MTESLKSKKALLFIFAGMMEITWLYAITCILFLLLEAPLFPIWTAVLAFFVPIIITSILDGRGRRIIEYVALHIFFYLLILLYTVYSYGNWTESFLAFQWLKMIFHQQQGPVDGFTYLLIIFWFSLLWRGGYKLAHRSNDHLTISSRFDLGIVALVSIFIILGSTSMSLPHSSALIIYYFLFSMFAISIAKNLKSSKTKHPYQLSRTSFVMTFILIVFLFGSWIVLFFLPQMTSAAQSGYRFLKILGQPLGSFLLKIILFLFGNRNRSVNVSPTYSGGSDIPLIENSEPTWFAQLLQWIITWGFIVFLGIIVIIAIGWLLWFLYKWFSTKTDLDTRKKGFFEEMFFSFINLFNLGKKYIYKIICALKKRHINQGTTYFFFKKLCNWGKISGIPRKISKTPQEYGKYLIYFFPDKQSEIQLIIDGFNRETYGNKPTQKDQLVKIKRAWQNLSSPLKWPLRLWIRVFVSKKQNIVT